METTDILINKYGNGKIYKIIDNAYTEQYIGSTVQPLSSKMSGYRRNYEYFKEGRYNYVSVFDIFDKYGIENCKIELLERFPCADRDDLMKREGHWIKNENCVNKRIAGRSDLEWRTANRGMLLEKGRVYRENNKETLKEKQKEHYNEHKADMLKKQKIYRDEHKEQIKERREQSKEQLNAYKREKIECQHCNVPINRGCMNGHIQRKHPEHTK